MSVSSVLPNPNASSRERITSEKSLRVLLISHTCQSKAEGHPKAARLSKLTDIDLHVLIPDRWYHYGAWRDPDIPNPQDFKCTVGKVSLPWTGPAQFYLHWYPGLKRLLLDFKPHIIDLWEEPWALVSAHAVRLRNKFLPETKIVSETEQNINKTLPFPFERFRTYTLKNADYAVCRNREAISVIRSKGYTGPAEVVPNAVDADLFCPLDRAAARNQLKLEGFLVGYVGRLVEEKGLMDLIDALPLLPPHVKALFVGSGPFEAQLKERARQLNVSGRAMFLPARPLHTLPELMNALDVLVLPSRTTPSWKEQFGRVIIEAHACQVPVVGSDSGAIPDVIGGGGLIVPERNPSALAAALNSLASDPAKASSLGRAGRRQVEAQYTWDRVAQRMREIYLKVTSSSALASVPLHPAGMPANR
jgi:glycosyltransferase involved in cell wall biosynthesis